MFNIRMIIVMYRLQKRLENGISERQMH